MLPVKNVNRYTSYLCNKIGGWNKQRGLADYFFYTKKCVEAGIFFSLLHEISVDGGKKPKNNNRVN